MYGLLMGYIGSLKIPRFAIASLVPFMVEELKLPATVLPTLLAAFHPGYIASMMPGGKAVDTFGSKPVILVGSVGTALSFALFPIAAATRFPVTALSVLMAVSGLFQGPMAPSLGQANRDWMPDCSAGDKIEKAWALKFQMLSHTAAPALSALMTPRLAAYYGWRKVVLLYGVLGTLFGVVFQLGGKSKPAQAAILGGAVANTADQAQQGKTKGDWNMFKLPSVHAIMAYHIAYDNMNQTMTALAPTMFMRKFGLSAVQMSSYVASAQAVHIPVGFCITGIESLLLKRGVPVLRIRKAMTCWGSLIEAVLAVAYGAARTPLQASIAYAALDSVAQLHSSGAWPNFMEVGGEYSAMLYAVDNTFAQQTAILVPFMGIGLQRLTGSWLPHLLFGAALKLISGTMFLLNASVTPAKEQLEARRCRKA